MATTEIYLDGNDVSVLTHTADERDFVESFTIAFMRFVGPGINGRHHRDAMQCAFDIIARIRGYKSTVQERRILAAGRWPHPAEQPASEGGTGPEEAVDADAPS